MIKPNNFRIIFYPLIIFILLIQTSVEGQDKKPTLIETFEFIRNKVSNYGVISGSKTKYKFSVSYSVNFDGCTMVLIEKRIEGGDSFFTTIKSTIELSDLDENKIDIIRQEEKSDQLQSANGFKIFLEVPKVQEKIKKQITTFEFNKQVNEIERNDFFISIGFNDENIANRVANAFKYAIKNCRDKEPF